MSLFWYYCIIIIITTKLCLCPSAQFIPDNPELSLRAAKRHARSTQVVDLRTRDGCPISASTPSHKHTHAAANSQQTGQHKRCCSCCTLGAGWWSPSSVPALPLTSRAVLGNWPPCPSSISSFLMGQIVIYLRAAERVL